MRAVKKWRYYCDHCSQAKMVRKAMEKHERGCTLNPSRVCGLCEVAGTVQHPMPDLLATLQDYDFEALKKLADDCPACILAALRQFNKNIPDVEERLWPEWDFKAELAKFWSGQEDFRMEDRGY